MRKTSLIATLIALFLLISPIVLSRASLNFAQLRELHGKFDRNAYLLALHSNPNDPRVRLKVGIAFASKGDGTQVIQTLLPLAESVGLSPEIANALLPALAERQLWSKIVLLSKNVDATTWTSWAAATGGLAHVRQSQYPIPVGLLETALGHRESPNEMTLLTEQMKRHDFWNSEAGDRLTKTLIWRAQPNQLTEAEYKEARQNRELTNTVAMLLNIPSNHLDLGNELVSNGGFSRPASCAAVNSSPWCAIDGWVPSLMTTGNPWNRAVFVLGLDYSPALDAIQNFGHPPAARVDGLVMEYKSNLEPARAGLRGQPIRVEPQTPYVITLRYRTVGVPDQSGAVGIWLSDKEDVFFSGEKILQSTQGNWNQVTLIAWNHRDTGAVINPLLRLWSTGTVWFDDVSIRKIALDPSVHVEPRTVITLIN
jgi:hypothetical protein